MPEIDRKGTLNLSGENSLPKNFIENIKSISIPSIKHLSILQCNYSVDDYNSNLFNHLRINLPKNIINATNKRKSEFLAGRYLCQLLLISYGQKPVDIPIGMHRQPLWP